MGMIMKLISLVMRVPGSLLHAHCFICVLLRHFCSKVGTVLGCSRIYMIRGDKMEQTNRKKSSIALNITTLIVVAVCLILSLIFRGHVFLFICMALFFNAFFYLFQGLKFLRDKNYKLGLSLFVLMLFQAVVALGIIFSGTV